jgi:fatty acid desaturase
MIQRRDYSLLGPESDKAVQRGLANGDWYRTPVERKRMKQLMQRSDRPALINTSLWIGLILVSGVAGVLTWGSWWTVPCFFVYGVLWGSGGDSRCHETGHGTAFKTPWMNDVVFQMGCYMTLREPLIRRWDHTRHHTDTIIVGRDREIIEERPPRMARLLLGFLYIPQAFGQVKAMLSHAIGRVAEDEKLIIPESEWPKLKSQARMILASYVAVIALAIGLKSILPLMLVGLPSFYGAWFMLYVGLTQHIALAEDVLDFRLNTRTVYMNPVFRFIYWNMNYHLEHHMFPMVPFHALKELHEEIRGDCPPAYRSTIEAYREIVPTLRQQLKDPMAFVHRELSEVS